MKRLIATSAAVAVALAVAACGGNDYPAQVKANFMSACERSGTAAACGCVFAKVQAKVSYDDFKRADTEARKGLPMSVDVKDIVVAAAADCG
jgi:mevalonate pyrophosphate decarboxylase